MADFSKTSETAIANTNVDGSVNKININKASYWKQMLKNYEKRNASLERKRSALVERVRFMECTLPSMLVGAAASAAYGKRGILNEHSKTPENTPKSTQKSAQKTT